MKRLTARILRRLASNLDPQSAQGPPRIYVSYNGQSVEKAMVTALRSRNRRHGWGGLA